VQRFSFFVLTTLSVLAIAPHPVAAQCPRPAEGSVVVNPPSLFSSNGVLSVQLNLGDENLLYFFDW